MKYIKKRQESLINESLMNSPYIGTYDFSNSDMEELLEELEKMGLQFSYHPDRNCVNIHTNEDQHKVYQLVTSLGGSKVDEMMEDDCVTIGFERPNVPEGSYS